MLLSSTLNANVGYSPTNNIFLNYLENQVVENNTSISKSIEFQEDGSDYYHTISAGYLKNSTLTNNNTIDIKTIGKTNSEAYGVFIEGTYNDGTSWRFDATKLLENSKFINNGAIKISSVDKESSMSIGIDITNYYLDDVGYGEIYNSEVINNGDILTTSEGFYASSEGIIINDVLYSKVINKGNITSVSNGYKKDDTFTGKEWDLFSDSFGINTTKIENSYIENSGSIIVNSNTYDNHAISEGITSDSFKNSELLNSGNITSTINNNFSHFASSILFVSMEDSEVVNDSTGRLSGNIILGNKDNSIDNNIFINKGFISLPYNANKNSQFYDFGNDEGAENPNTIFSTQPYFSNFTNYGTIEIGAFKNSNGNIENSQILAKNAKFESGSKMQVNVVAGSKPFIMGDTLSEVAKATEKLEGSENIQMNQTKLVDNSAILDFELIYDEAKKQIDLIVAKVNNLIDIGSQNGRNYSYNAIQIDEIARKPKNENVLAELQTVSLENYEKALESLVPTTQLSAINASNQITSNISNIIFSRLSESPNGLNSGDEMIISENNKAWIKTFGSIGKQKNKNDVYGFDLNSYGLGLGYDKEYKENQFLGLSAFYTKAETKSNFINHQNDIDAYSVVAYGSNLLKDNKTTIYYQTSYTLQKNDSTRELFTNEKANSKFTSKAFAADLKVGHKLGLNDKVSLEPKVGLEYTHYNSPTITESGSKNVNLKTNSFSSSKLVGTIGAELEYKINANSKLITSVKTGYDFKNDKNKRVSSSFVNNPSVIFNSEGINNGRVNYEVGVAYDLSINKRNNLNIAYKYVAEGSKFNNNILMVNYDHKF